MSNSLKAIRCNVPYRLSPKGEVKRYNEARQSGTPLSEILDIPQNDYVEEQMRELKQDGLYKDIIGGYIDYEAIDQDIKRMKANHRIPHQ